MKLQLSGNNQYHITIPHELIKAFDWRKGQKLGFKISGKGRLELYEAE